MFLLDTNVLSELRKVHAGRADARVAAWADNVNAARRSGQLSVPDPRPFHDGLIAATALVHGMTVVTRNVADLGGAACASSTPGNPEGFTATEYQSRSWRLSGTGPFSSVRWNQKRTRFTHSRRPRCCPD
jgi:predicted nucleic acid-binding protein